jgi:hypothetical protein
MSRVTLRPPADTDKGMPLLLWRLVEVSYKPSDIASYAIQAVFKTELACGTLGEMLHEPI